MSKTNSAIAGATAGASFGPVGAVIGGVGGYLLGKDDESKSAYEDLMRQAQGIPLPQLKEMNPELYKQIVMLNPELETAINLGPSAMEGISTDPKLRQAQLNALAKLQNISNSEGKDAQFLADNARLQNDVNSNLRGNSEAIKQNLATRGMSGGMSEMVARQIDSQNGANRQAQMGLDVNAQAQQRALQALMNGANLGGQMQSQDFNQQSQVAQAKDAINKFNVQNQQNVQGSNIANSNNAQQWNATGAQNTANKNTDSANTAQAYNNNLPQQQYDNQMKKYGLYSGAAQNAAQNSYNQAKDQDKFLGGLFNSAATSYAASKK